jgi:hypothetical protein
MIDGAAIDADVNLQILQFLQQSTGPQHRRLVGHGIAQVINRAFGQCPPESAEPELTREGLARLGQVLTLAECAAVIRYFEARPCFNGHTSGHSDRVRRPLGGAAEAFHYGSYDADDVVGAPHLLELANRPDILSLVERHLGCPPTLYSLHAWWSFSGHGKAEFSQAFHRDLDDYRFCALFVFLTDVAPKSGAHVYIRRSHRADFTERAFRENAGRAAAELRRDLALADMYTPPTGYGKDDLYAMIFPGLAETITGPAGTAFLADTLGLHKGEPLTEGRRLMFWARYGLYRNGLTSYVSPAVASQVRRRIGSDSRSLYINRCLLG